MDSFAFIIHPIDPKRDVSRKFPLLGRILTERQIDFFSTFFPPCLSLGNRRNYLCRHRESHQRLVDCLSLYAEAYAGAAGAAGLSQDHTDRSHGGEAGRTDPGTWARTHRWSGMRVSRLHRSLDIPVTTGDAFTVSIAVQAVGAAAEAMEIPAPSGGGGGRGCHGRHWAGLRRTPGGAGGQPAAHRPR